MAGRLLQRGQRHRGADTAPTRLRVHHQLSHGRSLAAGRREVEVAHHGVVPAVEDQQMVGALLSKFTQNLLAHRRHLVGGICSFNQFAHLLLLVGGQVRTPVSLTHWLRSGSKIGSRSDSALASMSLTLSGCEFAALPRAGRTAL
jgi:hypothetical protein